jgi:hypothetical protein
MLTHVFDQFLYSSTAKNITITTYLQFWNPSSIPTPALTGGTFTYNLNDTIRYTDTANVGINRRLTNAALANSGFNFGGAPFSFPANSGFITSITHTIDLNNAANFPNFPTTTAPNVLQLNNGGTLTNSYTLVLSSTTNIPAMTINRYDRDLTNDTPEYEGTILGLRIAGPGGTPPWRTADPRMTTYLGAGSGSRYDRCAYTNTYFRGYPAQELDSGPLYANPVNWPDGPNTTNNPIPTRGTTNPPSLIGAFTITNAAGVPDPAPCKISNFGSYTNICELVNIFDPIQWAPPTTSSITNYANIDITTGNTWTANTLYGGG